MGKGKIERETKREKRDFHLGGTQEEGENKVLPHLRRHKESMCKMKPHKKEKEERAVKREPLREKRRQPRESYAWRRK